MDWDQQFWDDYGFTPVETGADLNTTIIKHPCKKCDKKYITENQLEEYLCDNCDYKASYILNMKKHVYLHNQQVKCQICSCESKDTDEFIKHAIKNHSLIHNNIQEQQQNIVIECTSCGGNVSSRRKLTNHRKNKHFKEKLGRFYHENRAPCSFPDTKCIDIHGIRQYPQQSQQQRQLHQQPQYQQPLSQPLTATAAATTETVGYTAEFTIEKNHSLLWWF